VLALEKPEAFVRLVTRFLEELGREKGCFKDVR